MAVLLIRHAHAGSRSDWDHDDRLRPLSAKGRKQAASLHKHLARWTPERILSSPYLRCVDTVVPYAEALGLKVEDTDDLAEGEGVAALALIRGLGSSDVALCSHGDITTTVLVAIAKRDRIDLGPTLGHAKGSTWVLETRGSRFVKATYLPPPR